MTEFTQMTGLRVGSQPPSQALSPMPSSASANRLAILGEVKTDGYDYLVGSAVRRLSN